MLYLRLLRINIKHSLEPFSGFCFCKECHVDELETSHEIYFYCQLIRWCFGEWGGHNKGGMDSIVCLSTEALMALSSLGRERLSLGCMDTSSTRAEM